VTLRNWPSSILDGIPHRSEIFFQLSSLFIRDLVVPFPTFDWILSRAQPRVSDKRAVPPPPLFTPPLFSLPQCSFLTSSPLFSKKHDNINTRRHVPPSPKGNRDLPSSRRPYVFLTIFPSHPAPERFRPPLRRGVFTFDRVLL